MQRATALLYCVSGVCFVAGSCLFYPSRYSTTWYTHGDWLYITGCLLSGMGAIFALLTAIELGKTAETGLWSSWATLSDGKEEKRAKGTPSMLQRVCCLTLTDEEAAVLSCVLYLVGNALFVMGTLLFFPDILRRARELRKIVDPSSISTANVSITTQPVGEIGVVAASFGVSEPSPTSISGASPLLARDSPRSLCTSRRSVPTCDLPSSSTMTVASRTMLRSRAACGADGS